MQRAGWVGGTLANKKSDYSHHRIGTRSTRRADPVAYFRPAVAKLPGKPRPQWHSDRCALILRVGCYRNRFSEE